MPDRQVNLERDQDRVGEAAELFRKYGYVLFPQNRRVYQQIAERVRGMSVLEAGCGNGIGSAKLEAFAGAFTATDKLKVNVEFARGLYPWVDFQVWDVDGRWTGKPREAVVAVEVLEHVGDPRAALRNLIGAATREVWLSTPNGRAEDGTLKPRPPENEYHVLEYTTEEVVWMVREAAPRAVVEIKHWETFAPLLLDTTVHPLVYRVIL